MVDFRVLSAAIRESLCFVLIWGNNLPWQTVLLLEASLEYTSSILSK